MRRLVAILCLALLSRLAFAAPAGAPAAEKPIWLAVTRTMFVEALRPLAERREKDGFETVVSTEAPDKAIAALKRRPAFVVIVGDDRPNSADKPWFVPAKRVKLYRWRGVQPEMFASDMAWGDLDGDSVPDVPVSRIPVQTVDELAAMIAKIAAWEDRAPSPDDLSLTVWAGSANYSPVVDSMASMLLMGTIRSAAPAWSETCAIVCDPLSPFCGWPDDHPSLFERELRRRGGFNFMIGHGSTGFFCGMQGGGYSSDMADRALAKGAPAAPLLVLACHCGDFSSGGRCLTRAMLFAPGGPVAAIGATTESHPLTNYFTGQAFVKALDTPGDRRLGALWLASERQAAKAKAPLVERVLRDVEGSLEDPINVAALRRDQTLMHAMLGDAATRLRRVEPLTVKLERAGDAWRWQAERPADATELVVSLRADAKLPAVPEGTLDRETARKNFEAANATLAFSPLAKLAPGDKWEGTVAQAGSLRLVALAPGKLCVFTAALKKPASEPSKK